MFWTQLILGENKKWEGGIDHEWPPCGYRPDWLWHDGIATTVIPSKEVLLSFASCLC